MSDSPVIGAVGNAVGNAVGAVGNVAAAPVRSVFDNPLNALKTSIITGPLGGFTTAGVLGVDQLIKESRQSKAEEAQKQSLVALANSQARQANQDRIRGLGQNLASKGTQELSNIDFSGLDDSALASKLSARRDTLLQRRSAPGRTQSILASRLSNQ